MRLKQGKRAKAVAEPGLSLKKIDASPGMGSRSAAIGNDADSVLTTADAKVAEKTSAADSKSDLRHVPTLEHVPPDLPKRSPIPVILIGCIVFLLILILF